MYGGVAGSLPCRHLLSQTCWAVGRNADVGELQVFSECAKVDRTFLSNGLSQLVRRQCCA